MTTLNTIIRDLETFSSDHKQLNTFYSGDTWDFQSKTNVYPAMIAVTGPATVQQGRMSVSFTIFVADICNKDRSNVDEIHSDTLQILGDVLSYFKDRDEDEDYPYGLVETALSADPFTEEFDDVLAGWSATVAFEFPFSSSVCSVPV